MAFDLDLPRRLYAEFYLNSEWVNLIEHIRQDPGIKIIRARKNEQAKPTPSECSFWLDDSVEGGNGDYTPRNPLGAYYPYFGRNVPIRIGLEVADDNFDDRTSSAGWLGDWINGESSGGVIADTDWTVSGGTARHIVPDAGQWRGSYYNASGVTLRNCEIRLTWTRPNTDVLGASYACAIQFRVQDSDNYVRAYISVNAVQDLHVSAHEVINSSGRTLDNAGTKFVFANPNATTEIRAQMDGNTVRVKAWPSTVVEPLEWQCIGTGVTISDPGQVGIVSVVDPSNTNADPHTFQYDNWSMRIPRFYGETSEVVPDMDLTEEIRVTKVDCGTIFRRQAQGTAPVKSTLTRFITSRWATTSGFINYWPCEDEEFSNQIASGFPNRSPMRIGGSSVLYTTGGLGGGTNTLEFAADDSLACSAPLPHTNESTFINYVGPHEVSGRYDIRWLTKYPDQSGSPVWLLELFFTGTADRWHVQMETDGSLSVRAFDANTNILDDFGNAVISDQASLVYLQLVQNGANINYTVTYVVPGTRSTISYTSGTVNSQTLGRIVSIGQISGTPVVGVDTVPRDVTFGHLMLSNFQISSTTFYDPLSAFHGETSVQRMTRLASENLLLPFGGSYSTGGDTSASMGPQQVDTLLNLLLECADTDHGLFGDARGANSYLYIPLADLYANAPVCTLDHNLEHLAPDFIPTDDDAFTANDVTVKARRGSSARLEQTEGALNVNDPGTAEGAVGRYDISKEINPGREGQSEQSASWLLHLGTTNEARFPSINVNLHDQVMLNDRALTLSVLDLDMGDVLRVQNLEPWFIYDDVDQLVFGYTEILDTEYVHTIAFNTGPYSPYNVGNLGDIRLDSDNSTLVNPIDTDDTVFDVTTPGDTRWIVESDQINTARISAASGTTTSAVFSSAAALAKEINIGDSMQLYTSAGVLKEATVFTITDVTINGATDEVEITWTPAAASAVSTTNIVRTWFTTNFPFDIVINGEQMTVTDINLTSDPQQFVVTRGVNGLTKAHPADSEVKLYRPYWLGK